MARRRRRSSSPRWRGREAWRLGPYFRHYAGSAGLDGVRGGWTSQGFRLRTPAGPLTLNFTTGRYSWDNPGPGATGGHIPDAVMRRAPGWLTRQPDGTPYEPEPAAS